MTDKLDMSRLYPENAKKPGGDFISSFIMPAVTLRVPMPEANREDTEKAALSDGIVFEFTNDPAFLHQLHRLLNIEHTYTSPPSVSELSSCRVLIARVGKMCVGGTYVYIKDSQHADLLPMESDSFKIEERFPNLHNKFYGQIGQIVILPDYNSKMFIMKILKQLYQMASELRLEMLFAVCPLLLGRIYRRAFSSLGMEDTMVHTDIPLLSYSGVMRYLFSVKIENLSAEKPLTS